MNLHEYQAKTLLQKYGIPVPRGQVISVAKEVVAVTSEINSDGWVVKAQVHAGGRGKAGGVKVVKSTAEAQSVASGLLGKTLVTYQNAPDGQPVAIEALGSGKFTTREGEEKTFTQKININYIQGQKQRVSFDWKQNSAYETGDYKIEVYNNGFKIGDGIRHFKKGGLFG